MKLIIPWLSVSIAPAAAYFLINILGFYILYGISIGLVKFYKLFEDDDPHTNKNFSLILLAVIFFTLSIPFLMKFLNDEDEPKKNDKSDVGSDEDE